MKIRRIVFAGMISAVVALVSCSRDKFDINKNPDDITGGSVTPASLLPSAMQNTSRIVAVHWDWLNMWMGHWARNGTYQSMTEIETYRFSNDFQVTLWNELYANAGVYDLMVRRSAESGAGLYEAIARIMRAHNFQLLVDLHNNIPYSEAFKGTAVKTPKYDTGAEVYTDLFNQLDIAVSLLQNADTLSAALNPDIATSDLAYAGNAAVWRRMANTLRLRLLVHLHNGLETPTVVGGFNIAEQVGKITTDGFLGHGESMMINPGFTDTKPNPYYRAFVENEAGTARGEIYRAGQYAIDYYSVRHDPRIDMFYNPGANGHAGAPLGLPSNGDPLYVGENLSTNRGPGLLPADAETDAWIFTSVESYFLQAEARELGILTSGPDAETLLRAAIVESFEWLGLSDVDAEDYMAENVDSPDVDYNAAPLGAGLPGGGHYTILSQKWLALNTIAPFELFTDYRRTDFRLGIGGGFREGPPMSVDPGSTATKIPTRLLYPQSEYNYNAANVGAQGVINAFTSKIFWDLN